MLKKRSFLLAIVGLILIHNHSNAQKFSQIQTFKEPLVLNAKGSFYVGGRSILQTKNQLGGSSPEGHISIDQMYVQYMVPQKRKDSTSFVLVHGMHLSGKCWETTPDGRMGWDEYLTRKGYPVYVVDQVGIARSGFNQENYNAVKFGELQPASQGTFSRKSDENAWMNFRFGLAGHQQIADAKFPVTAEKEFSKQSVPHFLGLSSPNPNITNLSELASDVKNVILVSHSQSGAFPFETALLNPAGIKAMVALEPGGGRNYTAEQIKLLAQMPILIVFGDNLKNNTGMPGHIWDNSYQSWNNFVKRINDAGGKAKMIHLPEIGIKGNSHMLMQDTNNLEIADLILNWINDKK